MWKELQICSNLHNVAGIVRTMRKQSAQCRQRFLTPSQSEAVATVSGHASEAKSADQLLA
jgi:hypothetical protein